MNPANIATVIFLVGFVAHGYGVYALWGAPVAALVLGTELGVIGLVGSIRAA